jgi:hypothetical protein
VEAERERYGRGVESRVEVGTEKIWSYCNM